MKYRNVIDDSSVSLSTLKQLREGCVVQFMSNYSFYETVESPCFIYYESV